MKFYIKSPIALILMLTMLSISAFAENEKNEIFDFIQSQFKSQSNSSLGNSSSASDSNFVVEIGTMHNVGYGAFVDVPVTLNNAPYKMWGIDFLFSYDNTALSFSDVIPGIDMFDADSGCGWEYFAWREGSSGNCGSSSCPTGVIRVVGISDLGHPATHPSCFSPETPASMFSIRFLVSSNFTYNCRLIPIRFVWYDCGDNAISFNDPEGESYNQQVAGAKDVYSGDEVIPPTDSFPSLGGPADSCINFFGSNYPLRPLIDFYNGGVIIPCDCTSLIIGDININGLAYEAADAVLFTKYFLNGESIFVSLDAQIAATDINRDGETLKLEDLSQLIRIILGDIHPDSTIDSTLDGSIVNNDKFDKTIKLHTNYHSDLIWIMMTGEIKPILPSDHVLFVHHFDGSNTRILLGELHGFGPGNIDLFSYTGEGEIVAAQAATIGGVEITLRIDDVVTSIEEPDDILPSVFSLRQNYPNPFNNETVIEFDLPRTSVVDFEIINILGQVVYNVSGNYSAGSHTIFWDGSSNSGQTVGSGVYYYRISTADFVLSKKMVLLK